VLLISLVQGLAMRWSLGAYGSFPAPGGCVAAGRADGIVCAIGDRKEAVMMRGKIRALPAAVVIVAVVVSAYAYLTKRSVAVPVATVERNVAVGV